MAVLLGLLLRSGADRQRACAADYARKLGLYDDRRRAESKVQIWVGDKDEMVEQ